MYVSSSSSRKLPIFSPEPNGWLNTHAKSKMEPQTPILRHILSLAIKNSPREPALPGLALRYHSRGLHYQGVSLTS